MADDVRPSLEIFQTHPHTQEPLPTFIYLALSGQESLTLDPINQPVQFLAPYPVRVISFNLPEHDKGLAPDAAMLAWKDRLLKGEEPLELFIAQCQKAIDLLFENNLIDPARFAVGGLSRGALAAGRLAATDPRITHYIGWAPLIDFTSLAESAGVEIAPPPYSLFDSIDSLIGKPVKFLIGNHDTRVGTDTAYTFIRQLTLASIAEGIRSPNVELTIKPSIGFRGHGTAPETFKEGVDWLLKHFRLS